MAYKEYKVIEISESVLSSMLLGEAKLPVRKMETTFNEMAQQGWQVVFQLIEKKRTLLFWQRESLVVTFGR